MNRFSTQYQPTNPFLAQSAVYRYGFQGQEEDGELWSGSVSYKYRVEDARLGRFFSVDPLMKKYAHWTPYSFSGNQVINTSELEGLEPVSDVNEYAKQIDNKSGSTIDNSDTNKAFQKITTINGRLTQHQSSDAQQHEKLEDSSRNSASDKGLGLYEREYTANISAYSGGAVAQKGFGLEINFAGTVVAGFKDDVGYVAGINSNSGEREVFESYGLSSKYVEARFERVTLGTRRGPLLNETATVKFGGLLYVEQTTNAKGVKSSEIGLELSYTSGSPILGYLGLVLDLGVKQPLYKE